MRQPFALAHAVFAILLICSVPSLADTSTPLSEHSTATGLLAIGAGVTTVLNLFVGDSKALGIGGVAVGGSLAVAALADDADGDGPFIGIGCLCAIIGGINIAAAHDKQPRVVGMNITPSLRPHGWIGLQLSSSW